MNSNLSKSRVRNIFNRCGHMVSVSRRFVVLAKRRANVDHKALPSDQRSHCLNRGRLSSHFQLSDEVFGPSEDRDRQEWTRMDGENESGNAKQRENESAVSDKQTENDRQAGSLSFKPLFD